MTITKPGSAGDKDYGRQCGRGREEKQRRTFVRAGVGIAKQKVLEVEKKEISGRGTEAE